MYYLYVVKKICNNIIKSGILIIYKCYLKLGKKIYCVGVLVYGLLMGFLFKFSSLFRIIFFLIYNLKWEIS